VGLWPTTRALPPSLRRSSTRLSAAPRVAEASATRLGVDRAKRRELAAPGLPVGLAPAILALRPQGGLDDSAARHALAERAGETGKGLGGTLGAARDKQLVAAAQVSPNRERCLDALLCHCVPIANRVASELDLLGHDRRPPSL
jgi:hypothetical protein